MYAAIRPVRFNTKHDCVAWPRIYYNVFLAYRLKENLRIVLRGNTKNLAPPRNQRFTIIRIRSSRLRVDCKLSFLGTQKTRFCFRNAGFLQTVCFFRLEIRGNLSCSKFYCTLSCSGRKKRIFLVAPKLQFTPCLLAEIILQIAKNGYAKKWEISF